MQKFNRIADFIDFLEDVADNIDDPKSVIQTSTEIANTDFIDSLTMDEWEDIEAVLEEAKYMNNVHTRDEYVYRTLLAMGYDSDEIPEIIEYSEVDL